MKLAQLAWAARLGSSLWWKLHAVEEAGRTPASMAELTPKVLDALEEALDVIEGAAAFVDDELLADATATRERLKRARQIVKASAKDEREAAAAAKDTSRG